MKSLSKKQIVCIIAALVAAIALSGITGFFIGNNNGKAETEASWQAERELDIKLSRSDLDGLGEIDGPIYVTGHKTPDSDTVGSAIGYAKLLEQLGYDAHAVVIGDINNETKYILDAAGLEPPELLEDASGCNMVLVDHSEYAQSAEGLNDANIITILDHHGVGAVTTGNQLIYDARPLGSTATIVWLRYRAYGLEPDKQTAAVMMGSILSDTKNLQANVTFADREALKALSSIAEISDNDTFYQEMFMARLSYEGMTDEDIFFSDYKEYESGGTKYSIGVIEVYDEDAAIEMANRIKPILSSTLTSTGMDMAFAQIAVFHDDLSMTYLVPSDDAAVEVLQTAFSDQATFDGVSFVLRPSVSRKKTIVPAITNVLEAHPKE